MTGVQWQSWNEIYANPAVAASQICYSGDIQTSNAVSTEVKICVTLADAVNGSIDLSLLGADQRPISEAVAQLSERRFFSNSGCVSFTIASEAVSQFNIKVKSNFDGPIGLTMLTRSATSDPGGPTVDLTTLETTSNDLKTLLTQIIPLIDGLELITGNIKIDASTLNLAVDGVEALLTTISGNTDALETPLATIAGDTTALRGFVDGVEALLTTIRNTNASIDQRIIDFQAQVGAIAAQIDLIERHQRPLTWNGFDLIEPGSTNPHSLSADADRRGVRVSNNTGEADGRGAGTIFIGYNGQSLDRFNHSEFIRPGETKMLDCPNTEISFYVEGTTSVNGAYTVVRYY
jgi:hypothetical protein